MWPTVTYSLPVKCLLLFLQGSNEPAPRLAVARDTLTVGVVGHEKRSQQQSHKSSGAVDTGKRTRGGVVPPTQRILVNLRMVGQHKLAEKFSEVCTG